MTTVEEDVQRRVTAWLTKNEIYPMSVFFTYATVPEPKLSITFYRGSDLTEFLDLLDYRALCDKSGYEIYNPGTVILYGPGLNNLYLLL